MNKSMKYAYISFIFLLFSGCVVGPKYHEPKMPLPSQYEESADPSGSYADLRTWWTQFNDPLLDEFIAEALDDNYDLRIAVEKIEQARSQYRVERSYLWPEIDLNAVATRTRFSQNLLPHPSITNAASKPLTPGTPTVASAIPSFPPRFLNILEVGFDAIWEIDFFGKFRHQKNAAYYTWEAAYDDAQSVLIAMVSEVAVNYVNIRAVQNKIVLTQRKIADSESELAIAKAQKGIGLYNELQVYSLISTLETDRASLRVLEISFKQAIYALAYLLGRPPEGLIVLFQEVMPIPSCGNKVPVGLPSDLLRRRPDVRSAERQLAAATEQVGAAVADLFPHISLTGISFGKQRGSSFNFEADKFKKLLEWPSRMYSVGVELNWNLVDFGRVRGVIAVQNSLQRQALLNYEKTVIGSLRDVEGALVAYFEEQERKDLLEQKVAADKKTLEITEHLFKIGLATKLQVLSAQKNLLDSQNTLIESEQSLAGDFIALYKAIGGDWAC